IQNRPGKNCPDALELRDSHAPTRERPPGGLVATPRIGTRLPPGRFFAEGANLASLGSAQEAVGRSIGKVRRACHSFLVRPALRLPAGGNGADAILALNRLDCTRRRLREAAAASCRSARAPRCSR